VTVPAARSFVALARVALITLAVLCTAAPGASAQSSDLVVVVSGNPVPMPRAAERRSGEWFVPIAPIARALDIELSLDGGHLKARTRAGVATVYDSRTGEIRHGQAVLAMLRGQARVVVAAPLETLLFPLGGLVTLLGVGAQEVPARNLLRLDPAGRGPGDATAPSFSVGGLDYSVGVRAGAGDVGHYSTLKGQMVAGGVSISSHWLLSGAGADVGIRQALVDADFGQQRRLALGDQSSRTSVDALIASFRGAGFTRGVEGGFETELYAGQAVGTTRSLPGAPGVATYDATVAGFDVRRRSAAGALSFSTQWFDGDARSGATAGLAFARVTPRNQLKVQFLAGHFAGLSARRGLTNPLAGEAGAEPVGPAVERQAVRGGAIGFSLLNTFTPHARVSVTAQGDHYGRNFLTAREDAQFNAQSSGRLSAVLRPFGGINVHAGVSERHLLLGTPGMFRGLEYGMSGQVPAMPVQLGFFRSRQHDTSSGDGDIALTQYSATVPAVRQYSGSVQYSESRFGGAVTRNVSAVVSRDFGPHGGRLSVHEQWQADSSSRLGVEWQGDVRAFGASLRAGIERVDTFHDGAVAYMPSASMGLALPFGQRLHLSYAGERTGRTFTMLLSGSVARKRDPRPASGAAALAVPASLQGRVYHDTNADGAFDPKVDKGLANVTVWLNDAISVATDAQGTFRFSELPAGAHVVRAELDAVPADLVFATAPERTVSVLPYGQNTQNFTVVRTAVVNARVTYLDESDDSGVPVERPLPDVRIIADDEHDSYTDVNGNVVFASLPPGSYELRLDPGTLPEGYVTVPDRMHVDLRSGVAPGRVQFVLRLAPKEIILRKLERQETPRGGGGR
jgi:hypothetical protein